MRKRILSVLFILIITISSVPFAASAAGGVQAKLESVMQEFPAGSYWTETFDGGKQCYGFAKLVIYRIFGKAGSSYRRWAYDASSTTGMKVIGSTTSFSSSNVKQLLSNARCGDVLQFASPKMHSMIVCSVEADGVWVYDCNWDWACGVQYRKVAFGKWSGRNSAKLSLLRADNYDTINGQNTLNIRYNANGGTIIGSNKTNSVYTVITSAGINMRSGAGTGYSKVTALPVNTTFTVTETKTADGYTWGKTTYNGESGWCVISESGWTEKTGVVHLTDYYLSNGLIYDSATSAVAVQKGVAGQKISGGLKTAASFGLTKSGYIFEGWSTVKSGGTVYKAGGAIYPEDLLPSIGAGGGTVTLYARWIMDHNHTYKNYIYNHDATSSANGTETGTCTCGETHSRQRAGTKLTNSASLYTDVSQSAWYKQYVDYAVTYGIMNGSDNLMTPDANMTRAQFVQVLANMAGIDTTDKQVEAGFEDVPSGAWFAPAIKWASENGIVNGMGEGIFEPNERISREQMCTMLVRYVVQYEGITLKKPNAKLNFADDAVISSWAKENVYLCQQAGLVNGVTTTTFEPQSLATRAQVAAIMTRYHQQYIFR